MERCFVKSLLEFSVGDATFVQFSSQAKTHRFVFFNSLLKAVAFLVEFAHYFLTFIVDLLGYCIIEFGSLFDLLLKFSLINCQTLHIILHKLKVMFQHEDMIIPTRVIGFGFLGSSVPSYMLLRLEVCIVASLAFVDEVGMAWAGEG